MAVLTISHAVIQNGDGTWDARPSSSTTELVFWLRTVAGSADPPAASSPSTGGAYNHDVVFGA